MRSSERVKALVAAFNEGDVDRVMSGFSQDVEVAIPIYRLGEEVVPTAWNDKRSFGALLLERHRAGSRIEIVEVSDDAGLGAVAIIRSSRQGRLTVTFQFDGQGRANRVVVFKQ